MGGACLRRREVPEAGARSGCQSGHWTVGHTTWAEWTGGLADWRIGVLCIGPTWVLESRFSAAA